MCFASTRKKAPGTKHCKKFLKSLTIQSESTTSRGTVKEEGNHVLMHVSVRLVSCRSRFIVGRYTSQARSATDAISRLYPSTQRRKYAMNNISETQYIQRRLQQQHHLYSRFIYRHLEINYVAFIQRSVRSTTRRGVNHATTMISPVYRSSDVKMMAKTEHRCVDNIQFCRYSQPTNQLVSFISDRSRETACTTSDKHAKRQKYKYLLSSPQTKSIRAV